MDALLLLARTSLAVGAVGRGILPPIPTGGCAGRSREGDALCLCRVQLAAPALFADAPPGPFSLNLLSDRAIARGRLYGIVHDSVWCHLSRPEDLPAATRALRLAREPDAAERDAAS
jgi:MurNAc alpha-1-phosphate uridylyltransferase